MQSILAAASSSSGWSNLQILELGVIGFLLVLVILSILTGLLAGLSLLFKKRDAAPTPATHPTTGKTTALSVMTASASPSAGISEEHLKVVIAAAVHVALKSRPRTLRLAPSDTGWAHEGRRAIFHSRAVSTPRVAFRTTLGK